MKLIFYIVIFISFLLFITSISKSKEGENCYICYWHDTYVSYSGEDTKEKRKKAQDMFGCKVYATTYGCSLRNFKMKSKLYHMD